MSRPSESYPSPGAGCRVPSLTKWLLSQPKTNHSSHLIVSVSRPLVAADRPRFLRTPILGCRRRYCLLPCRCECQVVDIAPLSSFQPLGSGCQTWERVVGVNHESDDGPPPADEVVGDHAKSCCGSATFDISDRESCVPCGSRVPSRCPAPRIWDSESTAESSWTDKSWV